MLSIEKIGGTSMLQMEAVLQNIVFYGQTPQLTQRIFVVSAYAGVTDELLENRKTGAPGIYTAFCESRDCKPLLENLRSHLVKLNEQFAPLGLDLHLAKNFIENRIALLTHYLKSLSEVLASGYVPSANLYAKCWHLSAKHMQHSIWLT
jgi:aspartate kinase